MPFGTPDPIKPGAATGAPTSTPQNVIMPTVQQQQAAAAQQQAQAAQQAQFSQPMTSAGSIGTGIRSLASGHGMPGPTNAQGQPMGSSVINKLAQLRATNFSPTANSMSTGASGGMQGAPMGAGTGGVDGAGHRASGDLDAGAERHRADRERRGCGGRGWRRSCSRRS